MSSSFQDGGGRVEGVGSDRDRPRYYLSSKRPGWELVAIYAEEDIVEEVFDTREEAEKWLPRVRQSRMDSGQNEIPQFAVEDHR